jgi:hypothetical protein
VCAQGQIPSPDETETGRAGCRPRSIGLETKALVLTGCGMIGATKSVRPKRNRRMAKARKRKNKTRPTESNYSAVPKKPSGSIVLSVEGGEQVSNRVRRELKILKESIAQNTRTVEQRLAKTGTTPRATMVASAAKYYVTLKKLAEK